MIAAILPAPVDAAEPAAAVRPPKGAPFAAVIDAVPGDAPQEAKADRAEASDTAAPVADSAATTRPDAPAVVTDAAALIAQLCPPPPGAPSDTVPPACHSRESGNPAPTVELDSRVRGNDTVVEGKAPRSGKPTRQAGKAAAAGFEASADGATKPIELSVGSVAQAFRTADTSGPADPLAAAPLAEVAITHHLDTAHDAQWLDRLAQDIARSADGNANLRFSMSPEHLGRLTVDLAAGADGTAVRLTTESEQAHRIVSEAQPRLVAEARAQGLRISETQVDLDQRQGGQPQPQRSPDGQPGQDRPRPAVLWTELPQRAGAVAHGVPAARDLYA